MNYSEFERNAAKKVNQYASGVDGEALWAAIQPEVPSANKRRGFFWLFFAGFLFFAGGLYSINWSTNTPDPKTAELSMSSVLSEEKSIIPVEKTESEITTEIQPNAKESINNDDPKANAKNFPANQNQKSAVRAANLNINQTGNNKKYKAITTKPLEESLLIPDESLTGKDSDAKSEIPVIEKTQETLAPKPIAFVEENTSENTTDQTEPETKASEILENSGTPFLDSLIMEENPSEELDLIKEVEKPLLSPPAKGLGLNFGFGIYGGVSRSTAEFSLREGTEPTYLQNRLNSEKQLETLQLGLEVIAQTDKNLYFRTGIQYSRIGRKFAVDAELLEYDTIPDGIQAIYVNTTTNDTIIIYGEVVKEIITSYDKTTYNYFHLLDIPLLAGYSFSNDNWSIGVEAGAVFNVSNQSKGEIYDLNGAFYDLKTDNNDWYKTNIGVGFMAGLSAAYKLDYNFQVYISPTFRTGSVFSTDKNPLQEKHASLGVNAGVRYFLD